MSKIAREMYESTLREMLWQASEDLGVVETLRILNDLAREYSQELAQITHEQGVVVSKPERSA